MAPKQTARKASNYHRLPLTHRPTRSERPEPTCGCGITDKTLHEGVTCEVLKRRMAGKAPKNPKKKCVKAPPPHRARNNDDEPSASNSMQSKNDEQSGRQQ